MHRLLIIAIFLSLMLHGQGRTASQRPSPRPTILSQSQQNQTEPQQTKTNNHQRGSEDAPLIVSIAGTTNTKTEISKITKDSDTEPAATWLLVLFNGLLAIFTFCLYRSTEKLWQAGKDQMQITRDSLDLARQEFISSHRPIIVVRNFRLVTEKPEVRLKVIVDIANKGATPAKNITIFADIGFKKDNQWVRPIDIMTKEAKEIDCIAAGEYLPDIAIESHRILEQGDSTAFFWDEVFTLVIAGRIDYRDNNEVLRRTGFMRSLQKRDGSFVASDDPDEEYQD